MPGREAARLGMNRLEQLRALQAQGRLVLKARPAPSAGTGAGGDPSPARRGDGGAGDAPGPTATAGTPTPGTGPLPLEPVPTRAGTAYRWRVAYPGDFRHGRLPAAAWHDELERGLDLLAALAGPAHLRQAAPPRVEDLLFLDLETTGLSSAAGHRPFLAGLAWFEAPAGGPVTLVCEQYLLLDLEAEAAWLAAVARRVEEHPWLVTFNGRGFDWPMLAGRWHLLRQEPPAPRAHFDLLYPARRLWGTGGQPCNLRALERRLLGFQRDDDVPGAEIPGRFARFLREGDARGLLPVFRHNARDLLSLAGVTAALPAYLRRPPAAATTAAEALQVAREWERVDREAACAWYERALALARRRTAVAAVAPAARRLVPLYRRGRRWAEAVAVQAALCDAQHPLAPLEPWLDLAELWLRCQDTGRAAACLAAAERLWTRRRRLTPGAPGRPLLADRLERLRARLAAAQQQQRAAT